MRTILTIALNDLTIFFRERGNLIGLVILPVVLTLAVGWANSDNGNNNGNSTRLLVDVIDQDQSVRSAELLAEMHAIHDSLLFCPRENDAEDSCMLANAPFDQPIAIERAREGTTAGLLIIPAGYATAIDQEQPLQLDYYSTDNPSFPGAVRQVIENVLQQVNTAVVAGRVGASLLALITPLLTPDGAMPPAQRIEQAVYQHAVTRLADRPAAVRYVTTQSATAEMSGVQNGFGQSVPGMGSLYVIFTVLAGTSALLRERRQWTLQRLAALPLTRAQILGGKILAYFSLGMIQYAVVFAVGLAVGLDFGNAPLAMGVIMMAFALCMTALALALATRVTSEGQANGLRNLIGLTLAPLGGAWWPLEIVPRFMQRIGHLSPVAWAMDGFHELIFNQGTFVDILPEVGVLLAIAAVLFGIGVRGFRVE